MLAEHPLPASKLSALQIQCNLFLIKSSDCQFPDEGIQRGKVTCPRSHNDLDSNPSLTDSGAQLLISLLCCPFLPPEQDVIW